MATRSRKIPTEQEAPAKEKASAKGKASAKEKASAEEKASAKGKVSAEEKAPGKGKTAPGRSMRKGPAFEAGAPQQETCGEAQSDARQIDQALRDILRRATPAAARLLVQAIGNEQLPLSLRIDCAKDVLNRVCGRQAPPEEPGDDLRRLVLSLPDQTVGFGTAFLQSLVVELFGQLLKVVFHSVI